MQQKDSRFIIRPIFTDNSLTATTTTDDTHAFDKTILFATCNWARLCSCHFDLKSAFLAFSNFGAGANKQKNEMESKNFKKLVQECGLFKKGKLDGAEVDMIFTRCKGPMPCRNILFDSFKDKAIPQLATAVYGDDSEENKKQIIDAITSNSPKVNSSVKMCSIGVVDRLTDPSKYTGAHKERFDETGKGKGIEGREDRASTEGYVQGFKSPRK